MPVIQPSYRIWGNYPCFSALSGFDFVPRLGCDGASFVLHLPPAGAVRILPVLKFTNTLLFHLPLIDRMDTSVQRTILTHNIPTSLTFQ
jgi:hypothetical protein